MLDIIRMTQGTVMQKNQIEVAIGLLFSKTRVLVGWRNAQQHQGNKAEFPGGKIEQGETAEQACRREVFEEVGIDVIDWQPFELIQHDYDDVIVQLHVFFSYVPEAALPQIQQPWQWYTRTELANLNFPKANQQLVQRLALPQRIKIRTQLEGLADLQQGQVMSYRPEQQADLAALHALSQEQLNKLILNQVWAEELSLEQQAQLVAIHLKQPQLLATQRGELRVGQCYLAACHDLAGLQHAQYIGCDAALLSPVLATATHPEAQGLGWGQFQQIAQQVDLPIIALGGLKHEDLGIAQQHAAYGIAGISQV